MESISKCLLLSFVDDLLIKKTLISLTLLLFFCFSKIYFFSKGNYFFFFLFLSIPPPTKQGYNAAKMQGAIGSKRKWKDFRRNLKPNLKQGTKDKPSWINYSCSKDQKGVYKKWWHLRHEKSHIFLIFFFLRG